MAYHTLRQEYMLMPPVTRAYTTVCLLTSIAVVSNTRNFERDSVIDCKIFPFQQLDVVSPFQLYFNPLLITQKFEVIGLVCFCMVAKSCYLLFSDMEATDSILLFWDIQLQFSVQHDFYLSLL